MKDLKITNLATENHYLSILIQKLENAFHYEHFNHIDIDFYPLFNPDYFSQNHLLINSKTKGLIGHIGVRKRLIGQKNIQTAFFGGIYIDPLYQGKGYFKYFFNEILNLYKEVDLSLLWSDLHSLYKRFDFQLSGFQIEILAKKRKASFNANIQKTKLAHLNQDDFAQIKELYTQEIFQKYNAIKREEKDWEILKKISSSDLYLKRKSKKIVAYAFANKGQDLNNIIHEFVSKNDFKKDFYEDLSFLSLWTQDKDFLSLGEIQNLALIKINNKNLINQSFLDSMFISGLDSI